MNRKEAVSAIAAAGTLFFIRIPASSTIHPELSRWVAWVSRECPDADMDIFVNNIGIDRARNAICHQFLKSDCTHLWMLDADVIPPRKIPHSAANHQCWSGIYDHLMGVELCKSVWKQTDRGTYIPCERGQAYDATSGGCMIIPRETLEKIEPPWFVTHFNDDYTIQKGEDFDFCEKVLAAGMSIYVDPTYYCHHLKQSSLKILATRERMS